jgi:hypothetical protein
MISINKKLVIGLIFFTIFIICSINYQTIIADNSIITQKIDVYDTCNILFIGSSYFNFNNLPNLFENLSINSGKELFVDRYGNNGLSLDDHASSSGTESKINERDWDYVILQGAGAYIAYPEHFTEHPVFPALVILRDKIYQNCNTTKIIFTMPWAFEDGMTWYQDWTDTFEDMQLKIFANTINYSREIGFIIAPVGWAWYTVLEELNYPLHYLHLSDWNHPSLKGSYLMACVIFSTVFIESSIMIPYYCCLDEEEAQYFQNIASHTVMDNLSLWNIDNGGNNTPPYPPTIYGNANGKTGSLYHFNISTTDINDDNVYYFVDWGDEINEQFGPFSPGKEVTISHSWSNQDTYIIKVKAIDSYGAESNWSYQEITIPKSKKTDWPIYVCFYWGRIRNPVIEEIPWYEEVVHCYAKSVHVFGFETGFGQGIYSDTLRNKDIIIPYDDFKTFALDRRIFGVFTSHWIPQEYPELI